MAAETPSLSPQSLLGPFSSPDSGSQLTTPYRFPVWWQLLCYPFPQEDPARSSPRYAAGCLGAEHLPCPLHSDLMEGSLGDFPVQLGWRSTAWKEATRQLRWGVARAGGAGLGPPLPTALPALAVQPDKHAPVSSAHVTSLRSCS